jgi:hypothetical protein
MFYIRNCVIKFRANINLGQLPEKILNGKISDTAFTLYMGKKKGFD